MGGAPKGRIQWSSGPKPLQVFVKTLTGKTITFECMAALLEQKLAPVIEKVAHPQIEVWKLLHCWTVDMHGQGA